MPFRQTEIERLEAELRTARAASREREHVLQLVADTTRRERELKDRIGELGRLAAKENAESERLERRGPLTLLYTLLGSLEERRDRERQEAVMAALKVDEARAEAKLLGEQGVELGRRAGELEQAEARLLEVRARKRAWLESHDEQAARKLAALGDRQAELEADLRAIVEAAAAGKHAAEVTAKASALIASASGWGTLDLVGGGMVSSWVKHDRIDGARQLLPQVQVALERLLAEAEDVGISFKLPALGAPSGSRFVDIFLDNIVTDWASRASLSNAQDSLNDASRIISQVLTELVKQRRRMNSELDGVRSERERILG